MYEYRAKVVHVVDGDTLRLEVDLGLETTRLITVRLSGINCPEKNTPEGVVAMGFTAQWVREQASPEGYLLIHTVKDKREKYGRYLADVWGSFDVEKSLNARLVDTGNAIWKTY